MNNTRNMNPAQYQLLVTQKVYKFLEEYKLFIGNSNIPRPIVELSKYLSGNEAQITYKKPNYILKLLDKLFEAKPKTIKSTMYHEFTHILDYINAPQSLSFDEKRRILHAYSEYHAVHMEMKCACGFDNCDEVKKLDKNIIVYNGFEPLNIIEYLKNYEKDFIETIKICIQDLDAQSLVSFWQHSIYYQSKIDFFDKYCDFDIKQIIDVNIVHQLCGDYFQKLILSINYDKFSYENLLKQEELLNNMVKGAIMKHDDILKICNSRL